MLKYKNKNATKKKACNHINLNPLLVSMCYEHRQPIKKIKVQ